MYELPTKQNIARKMPSDFIFSTQGQPAGLLEKKKN